MHSDIAERSSARSDVWACAGEVREVEKDYHSTCCLTFPEIFLSISCQSPAGHLPSLILKNSSFLDYEFPKDKIHAVLIFVSAVCLTAACRSVDMS